MSTFTVISTTTENNVFKGTIEFHSPINKENSFGSMPLSKNAKSTIEVTIDRSKEQGHFEWEVPELEEYESGGLWFQQNELTDYDGVFSLPRQLIEFLEQNGFDMSYAS